MLKNAIKLFKDEEGATAVEYGLIVAAIAGLIIAVVFILGNKMKNTFNNVAVADPVTTASGASVPTRRIGADV